MKKFEMKDKLTTKSQLNVIDEIPELVMAVEPGLEKTSDQSVHRNDQISTKQKNHFCYLKTQSQSFKQFELRIEVDTLNFDRQSKSSNKTETKHTNCLQGVHIISDVRTTECPKTGDLYHSLALLLPPSEKRVIYFKSEQLRTYWYRKLLLA